MAGVLAALGGLVQINPVWLWGPYQAGRGHHRGPAGLVRRVPGGALRLAPPWDFTVFGHTVPEVFLPGVVLPGLTFALLYAWPFLEAPDRPDDRGEHNLLDRPRDRPVRTAIGVGVLAFYVVLTLAGGQDIFAQHLGVSIASVTWALRIALLVVPLAVARWPSPDLSRPGRRRQAGRRIRRRMARTGDPDDRRPEDRRRDPTGVGPAPTETLGPVGSIDLPARRRTRRRPPPATARPP